MHSNGSGCRFTDANKSTQNVVSWNTAVDKVQVVMFDTNVCKPCRIIDFIVESYDISHATRFEIRQVRLRSVREIA